MALHTPAADRLMVIHAEVEAPRRAPVISVLIDVKVGARHGFSRNDGDERRPRIEIAVLVGHGPRLPAEGDVHVPGRAQIRVQRDDSVCVFLPFVLLLRRIVGPGRPVDDADGLHLARHKVVKVVRRGDVNLLKGQRRQHGVGEIGFSILLEFQIDLIPG